VAGEANVPFFTISGSDFVEMFVGVGAARIRDLFATAKASAPAIIFIDEMDAVGRARTASPAGGTDEREAALNQLLVEMDGFDARSGVVVIGATNRPDVLDSALLRPGRFDRRITIDPPDLAGREGVLRIHTRGKPLAGDVNLTAIARRTAGFSGAELANVVNEAALLATRRRSEAIESVHLFEAIERVVAGPQKSSRVLSEDDKRRVAAHEAGHAICSAAVANGDAVSKVSIVARGHGGGFTWYQPGSDRVLATRSQLLDRLVSLLGGRAAEEIVFGEPSTGANDDLRRATALARRLVWECGMSERIGPLAIAELPLSAAGDGAPPWSESIIADLDREVQGIVRQALDRARSALATNRTVLTEMAERLIVDESLEGADLERLLGNVTPIQAAERVTAVPVAAPVPVAVPVAHNGAQANQPASAGRPTLVPEQLAAFRDIGTWLASGLAGSSPSTPQTPWTK
jgi:cell division protease FtsH